MALPCLKMMVGWLCQYHQKHINFKFKYRQLNSQQECFKNLAVVLHLQDIAITDEKENHWAVFLSTDISDEQLPVINDQWQTNIFEHQHRWDLRFKSNNVKTWMYVIFLMIDLK